MTGVPLSPNNAPEFPQASYTFSDIGVAVNTVVGTVAATDADMDTLSYSLTGTDASRFAIDANGQITIATALSLRHNLQRQRRCRRYPRHRQRACEHYHAHTGKSNDHDNARHYLRRAERLFFRLPPILTSRISRFQTSIPQARRMWG